MGEIHPPFYILFFCYMSSSSQLLSVVEIKAPKVKLKPPVPREVKRFPETEAWLSHIISLYDFTHHSEEIDTLDAEESSIDEFGIKHARRPKTSSVYLARGFLLFNDTGSCYYKNNKQSYNLGYINSDWEFMENTENSHILLSIQDGNFAFLKEGVIANTDIEI